MFPGQILHPTHHLVSVFAYCISDFVFINLGWYFAKDLPSVREKQLVGFCKVPLQTEPTDVLFLEFDGLTHLDF